MDYFDDGAVLPDSVPRSQRSTTEHKQMFGLFRGVVIQTIYPDNKKNSNGERMEYIVKVRGQNYPNCITMKDMAGGGVYQYRETILKESEKSFQGDKSDATYDENLDGEIVFVMFIEGHGNVPIIIGTDTHPKHAAYKNPEKKDGRFDIQEFNGIEFAIDKDSNYSITHVGRKDPNGKILNEDAVGSNFTMYSNGDFEFDTHGEGGSSNVRVYYNKADKSITMYAQENTIIMDASGICIQDKFNNSMKFEDGKITITAVADIYHEITGNSTINIGGNKTENITGNQTQNITGNQTLSATGTMTVEGVGGTNLGSGASPTNVLGVIVNLAGGGAPVARLGDMAIGTGNAGAPVVSNIAQGSPKVTSG